MSDTPICLVYGKEDPWVKPVWGLQVKQQVPEAPYYEISPAGHCPHDEVPEVCSSSLVCLMAHSIAYLIVHALKVVFRLLFVWVKNTCFLRKDSLMIDPEISMLILWEVENLNKE
jgi:carotenoid cleavage dioxygenase-like enzyme